MDIPRAAIYARISKDVVGKGLGIERQEELCRKLAADKGWQVVQVYADNDLSAYSGSPRPQYEAMLSAIEAGSLDAVVCVDQDRLTRQPAELEGFIALADAKGIALANVSGEIDLSTSDGRFRARIMGAVARQESERKSERIRRQKAQAASKGWAQGGRRRYGYQHARTESGEATLEVVPSEAEIIREAAKRVLEGESLRSIAIDLNSRGIPTATGSQWQVTTLRTMLTGPHTAGLRVHHGEIVGEANWEPILDRATFERLRLILGDPRRRQGGRPPTHLLTGILKCGLCGKNLRHAKRGSGGRYVCDPAPKGCGRLAISDIIEEAVKAEVAQRAPMERSLEVDETIEKLQAEIVAIEESMDRLAALHFAEGHLSEREYLAARSSLDDKRASIEAELKERLAAAPLTDLLLAPSERAGATEPVEWDDLDLESQRRTISAVLDRIVVAPGKPGSRKLDLSRLKYRWR